MLLIHPFLCCLLVNSEDLPWGAHSGLNGFEETNCTNPGSWKVVFLLLLFIKGIKMLHGGYNKLCLNAGCQDQAGMFTAASWALASYLQSCLWWLWHTPARGSVKDTHLEMSLSRAGSKMFLAKLLRCKIAGVIWVETNSIMTCLSVRWGDSSTSEKV